MISCFKCRVIRMVEVDSAALREREREKREKERVRERERERERDSKYRVFHVGEVESAALTPLLRWQLCFAVTLAWSFPP